MAPHTVFYIIISILIISFIIDKVLDSLNAKRYNDPIPIELNNVYDDGNYKRSQLYKKTNYRFGILTSIISFIAILLFFFFDGFAFVDAFARSITQHPILKLLSYFLGVLCLLVISLAHHFHIIKPL